MAELGKLLTFMYEEDRRIALELYEAMFDAAEDEQTLLNRLSSPTKQAVIVARAYDARERKLSVLSSTKDEEGYEETDEIPPFVIAINRVSSEALETKKRAKEPAKRQTSRFDEDHAGVLEPDDAVIYSPRAARKLSDTQEFVISLDEGDEQPQEQADESGIVSSADEEPAFEARNIVEQNGASGAEPAETLRNVPSDTEELEAGEPETSDADGITEEAEQETAGESSLTRQEEELAKGDRAENPPNEESDQPEEPAAETEEPAASQTDIVRGASIEDMLGIQEENQKAELREEPEKKPDVPHVPGKMVWNVPLLILFLIIGVPVTLALCCVILGLAAACLGLAGGLIALGGALIVAAFSGFAVLADILLLLGAAIVALALGLLAFWLVFWLLGVLIGLIRKICELAGVWCKKEVPEA